MLLHLPAPHITPLVAVVELLLLQLEALQMMEVASSSPNSLFASRMYHARCECCAPHLCPA
jgi:hypothetical protein